VDEFDLIARHFAPLASGAPGAFGLTDDAALVEVGAGRRLVVTKDMIVAGVHFLADDPADLIARKLLRVNLSDLAAMGAEPRAYLLAIALPRDTDDGWIAGFAAGLGVDQAAFGVHLVGGDTVATDGPLTASITALGEVDADHAIRRAGARPGDTIYVSGTLGDAALGLLARRGELAGLDDAARAWLIERYRLPRPRVDLGRCLAGVASAAIDISDGLIADLGHICAQSGVGAEVEAGRAPLSPATRSALDAKPELMTNVLTGGDDYELLFTASSVDGLPADPPLTAIGRITDGSGVRVIDDQGAPMTFTSGGYRHR
jgi:thiamine-monophosphate kinase